MQLFALFNVPDISLAEKKLVSLLCELGCPGCLHFRPASTEEWQIDGPVWGAAMCSDEQ